MSDAVFAGMPATPTVTVPRWVSALTASPDAAFGVLLACAWAMGHAYVGIEGDGRIYMGRVLADLDPAGVGRDYMFAMDGQSGFTLYGALARGVAVTLGFGSAVALLSILNLAAWFAAVAVLARALAPGRLMVPVLAAVCVLPRLYTPWNLLAAGEAIPVPRPLAEAAVLLAVAAMLRERWRLAGAALIAGALFHPIMAAPGFGVLLIALGRRDRRWFAAAGVLAAAALVAAASGLPFAARLLTVVDAEWLAQLRTRNPYLFLQSWPLEGLAPIGLVLATIAVGATCLTAAAREMVLAAVAVAAAGLLVQAVAGDGFGDLLVLQAQLWRALWLPAALAPLLAGVCLVRLPARGARGQIALALLLLAWLSGGAALLQAIAAALAVAVVFAAPHRLQAVRPRAVLVVWGVCIVLALQSQAAALMALQVVLSRRLAGVQFPVQLIWPLGLPAVPLLAGAYAAWRWPRSAAVRGGAVAAACLGLAAVACFWDGRTPAHADADAAAREPQLQSLLASRPGEVLWIDGDDVWPWARRANWNGMTHGGGLVFSRPLTMLWASRARAVVDAGLATRNMLRPWDEPISLVALPLVAARIVPLCARDDAPAWIVAPLEDGVAPSPDLQARVWSPPHAATRMYITKDDIRWRRLARYAVVPCAGALAKSPAG